VTDLATLDLSYAPPFAPVYDPVLAAAVKAVRPDADGPGRPLAPSEDHHEPAATTRQASQPR